MSVDTHTASLLYHYLRMLSVRVDRGTVARLLVHPLGNSMRGLSDALDGLEVRNAAYQLPPEYFGQLEAPFIAVTRQAEEPFCLVERLHGTMLTVYTRGRRIRMEREAFLRTWTGGVLVGEVTADTRQDRYFRIRNVAYWIRRYSLLAAWMLATVLVGSWAPSPIEAFYRFTLCAGVLVSSAILYKETADRNFLHRFCHIGKAVDCNAVLQSRGSRLAGVGLGEWSLFYFLTLLLFVLVSPAGGWTVVAVCGGQRIGFYFLFAGVPGLCSPKGVYALLGCGWGDMVGYAAFVPVVAGRCRFVSFVGYRGRVRFVGRHQLEPLAAGRNVVTCRGIVSAVSGPLGGSAQSAGVSGIAGVGACGRQPTSRWPVLVQRSGGDGAAVACD